MMEKICNLWWRRGKEDCRWISKRIFRWNTN